jgi:hypothetical protein
MGPASSNTFGAKSASPAPAQNFSNALTRLWYGFPKTNKENVPAAAATPPPTSRGSIPVWFVFPVLGVESTTKHSTKTLSSGAEGDPDADRVSLGFSLPSTRQMSCTKSRWRSIARRMTQWMEAFEQLDEAQQNRVKGWLALQYHIAKIFELSWETWIETYVAPKLNRPFDMGFMDATMVTEVTELRGESSFARGDAGGLGLARRPLTAQTVLEKFSPAFQETLVALLSGLNENQPAPVPKADIGQLKKLFPATKELQALKPPDFSRLQLQLQSGRITIFTQPDAPMLDLAIDELDAVLSKNAS